MRILGLCSLLLLGSCSRANTVGLRFSNDIGISDGGHTPVDAGPKPEAAMSSARQCLELADEVCGWLTRCASIHGPASTSLQAKLCPPLSRMGYCVNLVRAQNHGMLVTPEFVTPADLSSCDRPPNTVVNQAFASLFAAAREEHSTCYQNEHCISGRCRFDGACPGTCALQEPVGFTCAVDEDCESHAYCYGNTCRRLGADGELCRPNGLARGPCEPGLWCRPAPMGDHICAPKSRGRRCVWCPRALRAELCAGFGLQFRRLPNPRAPGRVMWP